jgi:hypothetical protein
MLGGQLMFGVSVPWVFLLWEGHVVYEIPYLDFTARTTTCYFNTLASSVEHRFFFASLF